MKAATVAAATAAQNLMAASDPPVIPRVSITTGPHGSTPATSPHTGPHEPTPLPPALVLSATLPLPAPGKYLPCIGHVGFLDGGVYK
jgi:hypothetical protein